MVCTFCASQNFFGILTQTVLQTVLWDVHNTGSGDQSFLMGIQKLPSVAVEDGSWHFQNSWQVWYRTCSISKFSKGKFLGLQLSIFKGPLKIFRRSQNTQNTLKLKISPENAKNIKSQKGKNFVHWDTTRWSGHQAITFTIFKVQWLDEITGPVIITKSNRKWYKIFPWENVTSLI